MIYWIWFLSESGYKFMKVPRQHTLTLPCDLLRERNWLIALLFYLQMNPSNYSDMQPIIDQIDTMMKDFSHTCKDIWYGLRWTFDNWMRFDLIDYKRHDTMFLRVGRGAWFVKQYPILHGMFDNVSKVIAKFEIHTEQTLNNKHFVWLLPLLDQAPSAAGLCKP